MMTVWSWIAGRLEQLGPLLLAVMAGLALAVGLRRSGERAVRRDKQGERSASIWMRMPLGGNGGRA